MKPELKEIMGEIKSTDAVKPQLLETFEYEYPGKEIELDISTDEFTCVCPRSGLPDFATIKILYMPDERCIELKSLKYYLMSYRNVGIFHEHAVNRILEDFVRAVKPKRVTVEGDFKPRGGVHTVSKVKWERDGG